MSNKKLFEDSSDEDEDCKEQLSVNKSYAQNYRKWRKKEDYQKLKDKFGVNDFDSESDSEESNDEEYFEPDHPEFDMDFFRVLAAIRMKHPILDTDKKFFKDSYQSKICDKKVKEKPLTVTEYEKKLLIERGGRYDDEDDDFEKPGFSKMVEEYVNEHANKKEKFKFNDNLSDDDDEDLFTKKEQPLKETNEENLEEENEAIEFLKGKKKKLKDKTDEELLSGLKKDWETNKMSKKEQFLMDYFINKRYLEDEDNEKERAPNHYVLDIESLEEDEETFNKMEEYESKYRFRFEEPDEEFIRQYPRVTEETVRMKENKRKEERDKRKDRLKEEEEKRKQEILRLKAFKKQDILERIDMLQEASGLQDDSAFQNINLEEDFDPDKHDAAMSSMFNTDYYAGDDSAEKPTYEDEEIKREIEEEYEKLKQLEELPEGIFKYRNVCDNSYGLTTKEILYAKDTELNQWYSLNGVLRYREGDKEELRLKKNYSKRAMMDHVKKKIFPSLYSDNIEEQWQDEEEKKRKRNRKKKEKKMKKFNMQNGITADVEEPKTEKIKIAADERLKDQSLEIKEKLKSPTKKNNKKENESVTGNFITETKEVKKKVLKKESENSSAEIEATEKSKKKRKKKLNKEKNRDLFHNNEMEPVPVNTNEDLEKNKNDKKEKKEASSMENKNENSTKSKKRKIKHMNEDNRAVKKPKLSKDKLEKRNQLMEISDARLEAYGHNPRKIKRLLKYSEKYN